MFFFKQIHFLRSILRIGFRKSSRGTGIVIPVKKEDSCRIYQPRTALGGSGNTTTAGAEGSLTKQPGGRPAIVLAAAAR